jgi:sterol desaturase/sphingolipid hydroxylase (fatty acid hydroxylase superfamily)
MKIKIQKLFPKPKDYYRDIIFSVFSMTIFSTVAYITFTVLKPYNNIYYGNIYRYGAAWYCLSYVWMFFLHDAYFYWMHRLMHHPRLFKPIHLVHHLSTNPSPWTAYAFHPLESIIEAGIAPVIAFTLPVHRSAFIIFMLFQIIYNVYGHLGFELYPKSFAGTRFGKWINTGTAHNMHHKFFKGNYGLYTLIWDRWMGTLRTDYEDVFKKKKKAKHFEVNEIMSE